jgi:uncharacterized DUF497 family protein
MNKVEFEWDDAKAAANYAKHGVSFAMGCDVFNDPFAIEQIDDRHDYGEDRWTILGMAQGRILLVAYTMRQDRVRLISVRAAEPFERREYHEQNDRDDET